VKHQRQKESREQRAESREREQRDRERAGVAKRKNKAPFETKAKRENGEKYGTKLREKPKREQRRDSERD